MSLSFQPLQQINFIPAGVLYFGNKSITSNNRFLAFSSYDTLYVYDLTNFRLVRLFKSAHSIIRTIDFSKQNDNYIAIATNSYAIIYDVVMNCQVSYIYTPHPFSTICWTPDDSIVLGFSRYFDAMFYFESKIESIKKLQKDQIEENLYNPNHCYYEFDLSSPENPKNEEQIHRIQILFENTSIATSVKIGQKGIFVLGSENNQIVRLDFKDVKFDFFKAGKEAGQIKKIDYDPFNSSNCLTTWSNGLIILVDVSGDKIFEIHRVKTDMHLSTSVFLSSHPGHFITGNETNGIIRLYSSISDEPIEKVTIGNCGLVDMTRASSSIKSLRDAIIFNFVDGSISIYDFFKRQTLWQNHSGHTNTVFETKFLPSNPEVLVSLGADGTVRTWNFDNIRPIDRFSAPDENFICMTITHGSGYIICGCQSGRICVFGVKMNKLLYKHLLFQSGSRVRSIDSSPHQPNLIIASSEDGQCFLFDVEKRYVLWSPNEKVAGLQNKLISDDVTDVEDEDLCKGTNVKDKNVIQEQFEFVGVSFSPHEVNTFAICSSTGTLLIVRKLQLHPYFTKDKYDLAAVQWCPHENNILLTTSDSGKVTLWKLLNDQKCEIKEITCHDGKSRGIAFHPTFDCLAASTGYDGCIHLFNTKTYEVYCQISAHFSPIFGLTFSPINPYLIISSGSDTTIKFWSFDKIFQSKEEYLIPVFSKSVQSFNLRPIEGNQELKNLLIRLDKDDNNNENDKNSTFSFKEGAIVHINDCIRIIKRRIQQMISAAPRETSIIKKAIKSKERMINAANFALMSGNPKKYCELLFAAGYYDKALAAAPSVSYEFWKNLMKERLKLFSDENSKLNCKILIGEPAEAIKDELNNNEDNNFNGAMLISASQIFSERTLKIVHVDNSNKSEHEPTFSYCDLKFENDQRLFEYSIASIASKYYLSKGKVYRATSCFLAVGDIMSAINLLMNNGELMTAAFIANKFNLMNEKISLKLMKINASFVWNYLPKELQIYTFPLLSPNYQKVKIKNIDTHYYENETSTDKKMLNLLIGNANDKSLLNNCISIGLSFLTESLQLNAWDFHSIKNVLNVFELIPTDAFKEKDLILLNAIDFYVASFDALWKGFDKIILNLLDVGEFLALKIKDDHPWISDLYSKLKTIMKKFSIQENVKIVPVGFDLLGASHMTLEDSNDHQQKISTQELLMWQNVTSFSPTGSCSRIYYV